MHVFSIGWALTRARAAGCEQPVQPGRGLDRPAGSGNVYEGDRVAVFVLHRHHVTPRADCEYECCPYVRYGHV